jgi:hypothetical protein
MNVMMPFFIFAVSSLVSAIASIKLPFDTRGRALDQLDVQIYDKLLTEKQADIELTKK